MFYPVIISPNQADRSALRSLLENSGLYTRVQAVRSPVDALKIIAKDPLIDVIFLSLELGEKRILNFLDNAKQHVTGKRCSYVVLARQEDFKSNLVVNLMMAGIHSFLSTPYTTDGLQEATLLATDVNSGHSRVRLRLAGGLLFTQIADELVHGKQTPDTPIRDRLRDHAAAFRKTTGRSFLTYLDSVASTLLILSPTNRVERARGQLRTSIRRSIEELFKQSPQ